MSRLSFAVASVAVLALLACTSPANAIDVVPNLNVTAYLGRWYQIADDFSSASTFRFFRFPFHRTLAKAITISTSKTTMTLKNMKAASLWDSWRR